MDRMVVDTSSKFITRLGVHITGTVQGVGFRPYIYRLATELSLTGWVLNDTRGVYIEVQGENIEQFLQLLPLNLPPLAKIKTTHYLKKSIIQAEKQFLIRPSEDGVVMTDIGADTAVCQECLMDLFDHTSRYYSYPFVSCCDCGPRYSITKQLPFDRDNTSMQSFKMCSSCETEYTDPNNRRYHAQTIACAACGPKLSHTIENITQAIKEGKIVAIKSVGGYQLICDAHNENAIIRLRKNKERSHKPFIIMALNTQSASQYVALTEEAKNILESHQRPIVILPKIENNLPTQIAPHLNTLGVMLPYTPIHYLIFERLIELKKDLHWLNNANPNALIVTSGNNYGNPIITDDELAEKNLTDIADLIVNYNRDIVSHVDDSVVNLANDKTFFIRRARSYALQAIELPYEIPATIALGGHLKSTICITRNNEAFVSQHIADLTNVDSINVFHKTLNQMLKLLNIKPACVAHDTHPNFYTSRLAPQFKLPIFAIQHHYAHLASMAAQTKLTKPALGLALDGFGLGERQESWGGELMHYQTTSYSRLGSLKPVLLPGGEQVVKQPWRMAVSILYELNKKAELHKRFSYYPSLFQLVKLLDEKVYMPMTTSCARLFDAISALLGICEFSTYEGQAAMMLESKVTTPTINEHGWSISDNQLNLLPLIDTILTCNQQDGANVFHGTLAAALIDWVVTNIVKFDTTNVILAGGCFLNRVLLELMINGLKKHNLTPIFPEDAIPSDAGLSLGQAWVAGNRMIDRILR